MTWSWVWLFTHRKAVSPMSSLTLLGLSSTSHEAFVRPAKGKRALDVNTYFSMPYVEASVNAQLKAYQGRRPQTVSGWDVAVALSKARQASPAALAAYTLSPTGDLGNDMESAA